MNGDRAKKEYLGLCVFDDRQGKLGNRVQTMVDDIIRKVGRNINCLGQEDPEIRYVFDVAIEDHNKVYGTMQDVCEGSGLKGYIYIADCQYSNADVVDILLFFSGKMANELESWRVYLED